MVNVWRLLFFTHFIVYLSCNDSEDLQIKDSLSLFIAETNASIVNDSSVIACSSGIPDSVNVFYYVENGFSNHQIWILENADDDPSNFSNYIAADYPRMDIFNGSLQFFLLSDLTLDTWVTITSENGEELNIAQPIHLKPFSLPTELNINLLEIDLENELEPAFSWQDGMHSGNVIYFHVVSDEKNDIVSGTYTFDRQWRFYDLSNVVLNITKPNANPVLFSDMDYNLTLMGISRDNWVNFLIETAF